MQIFMKIGHKIKKYIIKVEHALFLVYRYIDISTLAGMLTRLGARGSLCLQVFGLLGLQVVRLIGWWDCDLADWQVRGLMDLWNGSLGSIHVSSTRPGRHHLRFL